MRSRPKTMAIVALTTMAPSAGADTLAQAIADAYRTNPVLGASRYGVRQADENVVQADADNRLTATVQSTATFDHLARGAASQNFLSPPVTNADTSNVQLAIAQPLYSGGKATADRRSAIAGVEAARAGLRGTEGDLLLAVVTAYLDVRRTGATLAIWRSSVGDLERLVKEIEARRDAGELTLTDVAQARNQLQQEREQAVASEQQLEAARADFADYVGREPEGLEPPPPLPHLPTSAEAALASAEQRSPELARALFTERGSRADVDVSRAAGAPTVSLRGTATLSGPVSPYRLRDQDRDVSGSVVLAIPLSAGGRIASQVRQARDRNLQDRLQVDAARRDLARNVANAWNALASAQSASALITERRRAAATQLDGMLAEYRVGLRSTFDVLYAQQSLRDAEVALLGAERDRYVASATLLRRVGDLDVEDLVDGIQRYDPAPHLERVRRINALPWDGAFRAIDVVPPSRRSPQPLAVPPATGQPTIRAAAAPSNQLPLLHDLTPARTAPQRTAQPSDETSQ